MVVVGKHFTSVCIFVVEWLRSPLDCYLFHLFCSPSNVNQDMTTLLVGVQGNDVFLGYFLFCVCMVLLPGFFVTILQNQSQLGLWA